MKRYLVARLMEHSFLHNLLDPLLWFTFTTPYIYTEPVAGSLLHYQLAKCQLREHLKLTHFPVKRVNSVKLVHMWITLKSPRVRESHSWFSTRSTGWGTVCGKWKKKEKKMRIWVHFLMKCALIYIEAQGQRRIWISSEVTLKRVHTLAAENKQA